LGTNCLLENVGFVDGGPLHQIFIFVNIPVETDELGMIRCHLLKQHQYLINVEAGLNRLLVARDQVAEFAELVFNAMSA